MANTTDWVRGKVALPHLFKDAAAALLVAARLRPVHRVRPLTFFTESPPPQPLRQSERVWRTACRLIEKAAERARRAAKRSVALDAKAWAGMAYADLSLSRRAMTAFSMIEIRVHVGIRTFAASRALVDDTCEWLATAADAGSDDAQAYQAQLLDAADRLDAYAREFRIVLRLH